MRAILCVCALALLCEAIVGMPYVADAEDDFDDALDMSKRVVDLLAPSPQYLDKRNGNTCPIDCFSCTKFIRGVIPNPCVRGCRRIAGGASYSSDRKMWNRCASFLSRPLAR